MAPKLFVAMPYGLRKAQLDWESPGRLKEIDFNGVWEEIFKPAIPKDFEEENVRRADELRRSGPIDRKYIEWLYDADVVLADLTFGNPNVFYELGIRHALSRKGTVMVACEGARLPFDVQNQTVFRYDYFKATTIRAFQAQLREALNYALTQETDSPVHIFLPELSIYRGANPAARIEDLNGQIDQLKRENDSLKSREDELYLQQKIEQADSAGDVITLSIPIAELAAPSVNILIDFAIKLRKFGHIDDALEVLQRAFQARPMHWVVLRELGFAYRKKGPDFYDEAEKYMKEALRRNHRDPELQGMFGGLLKRRGAYKDALERYEIAHELEPDNLYPIVNLGAIHAALRHFQEAREWYDVAFQVCEKKFENGTADYWTYLCLGEAAVVQGDEDRAIDAYKQGAERAPREDFRSATEQLQFLVEQRFAVPLAERMLVVVSPFGDKAIRPAPAS